jgi:hypothetical protein
MRTVEHGYSRFIDSINNSYFEPSSISLLILVHEALYHCFISSERGPRAFFRKFRTIYLASPQLLCYGANFGSDPQRGSAIFAVCPG